MEPISKQNSKEIESANKYNSSVNFNIDNLISSDQKNCIICRNFKKWNIILSK